MKQEVKITLQKQGHLVRLKPDGSDRVLFFGGLILGVLGGVVLLFRREWRGFMIVTAVSILAYMIYNVVSIAYDWGLLNFFIFNFIFWAIVAAWYPKVRFKQLLANGYKPTDKSSKKILQKMGVLG